jgi:hypothetical protein
LASVYRPDGRPVGKNVSGNSSMSTHKFPRSCHGRSDAHSGRGVPEAHGETILQSPEGIPTIPRVIAVDYLVVAMTAEHAPEGDANYL